jgi:hypothetical protein
MLVAPVSSLVAPSNTMRRVDALQHEHRAGPGLVEHVALEPRRRPLAEAGRVAEQPVAADTGVEDGARPARRGELNLVVPVSPDRQVELLGALAAELGLDEP